MSNVRQIDVPPSGNKDAACGSARNASSVLQGLADMTVHVDGGPRDGVKIAYAETIGAAAGAHVSAFMTNRVEIPLEGHPGIEWIVAEIWKQATKTGDEIERSLRERLDKAGTIGELRRVDAALPDLAHAAARIARSSDLFVCGRPYGDERHWPEIIEALLFEECAPVVVVPPGYEIEGPPRTIVVGWRDTSECANAVNGAFPFLKAAAGVHLVSIAEGTSDEERRLEPAADMARHLSRHGVAVDIRHLPHWNRAGEGLIHEAAALGADLIVAGAYGHSRWREWILGGATRDLLSRAPMPVFFAR